MLQTRFWVNGPGLSKSPMLGKRRDSFGVRREGIGKIWLEIKQTALGVVLGKSLNCASYAKETRTRTMFVS